MDGHVTTEPPPRTGPKIGAADPWEDALLRHRMAQHEIAPPEAEVRATQIAVLQSLSRISAFPLEGAPFAVRAWPD